MVVVLAGNCHVRAVVLSDCNAPNVLAPVMMRVPVEAVEDQLRVP